ncbi:flagellar hook protein FlgE [Halomonas sp. 7T]|uniref:flagellar hook protein FlgE n=1 Tax=Halomonas sp. 7T TaxID=2893469 RepID=UPI0021D9EF8D|nr:flagellar hook protein FlgE [Halomonas sp. 7T]UXZ53831.1 flagellar hook protein FlgE [Halomonas sp. 7T]
MSFSQALSGLNAQQSKLAVTGNNIANSQTVGFKGSNVQFADVYAQQIGLGTRVSATMQDFTQGNIEASGRNLDLAIAGEGFFRFQLPNGDIGYSRNGQLNLTADGRLVNSQGAQIMGFPADDDGNVQGGGDVEPLNVPAGDLEANATDEASISLNLDAGVEALDPNGFDAENVSTYNYSTNATIYDSQGNARNLTLYFIKDINEVNDWEIRGRVSGGPDGAEEYNNIDLGTLEFNQNGTLAGDNSTALALNTQEFAAGAQFEALNIDFNFNGTTQFSNNSTVNNIEQTGYTSGVLVGTTIEEDGTVMMNYSNEQSRAAGQIAMVSFRNPEGLNPSGDNLWSATASSGPELVGAPGTGQRGLIQASAIETSNVDLARELVDMIVAQRAYQANSQTISTQDELLQTIINI